MKKIIVTSSSPIALVRACSSNTSDASNNTDPVESQSNNGTAFLTDTLVFKMSTILKLSLAILVAMIFAGCKSMSRNPGDQGLWISLFDGKSTKGWHTYGQSTAGSAWKVENGILIFEPSISGQSAGRGDLVSDNDYENFHLKIDWKISENGNSGVIFYVSEDPARFKNTWNTGLEMQVLDNNGNADGKIYKHHAGDLYDLVASSSEPVKPVGQWNTAEIISNKGNLELRLNGVSIVKTMLWNQDWQKLVVGSKFKNMPYFGTFRSGKIALQDHGDKVWYRNIMIKKL
jgi:hypothetical protein